MFHTLISLFLIAHSLCAEVTDPYYWLEEESQEQKAWIAKESIRTEEYFSQNALRENFRNRITQIAEMERIGLPEEQEGTYYYTKRLIGANKSVLIMQKEGKEEILIDPNEIEGDVSLSGFSLSPGGRYLAYGLSLAGSDQELWQIYDLASKELLPEKLEMQFSSVHWNQQESSFFYNRNCREIARHNLREDQKDDEVLYQAAENTFVFCSDLVFKESALLFSERPYDAKNSRVMLLQLAGICTPPYATYEILPAGNVEYNFIGEGNGELYFITDEECCFGKIITAGYTGKKLILPEKKSLLQDAVILGDYLVCVYYKNALSQLEVYDLTGKFLENISLPGNGSTFLKHSKYSSNLYYLFTDFKTPSTIFSYDFKKNSSDLFFKPKVNFDADDYITEQRWYKSKDGTFVPLFISHRQDLRLDEATPLLIYGYGGFGLNVTPSFRPEYLAWMESGGVLAVPSLRGGKEFGSMWHDLGRKLNKQNVFDDCISAAEYLQRQKIGSPETTAVYGTSNGGLLAGACVTQRPDLFKAAIVNKGVLDMLRFHLYTVGKYWISDYGNPDDPTEKAYLLSYSPYHQVKKGTNYPAILINTADHDDRVVPMHSFKFAAALLEANASEEPILLRIESACGHGGSSSTAQEIAFTTDMLTFLFTELKKEK